MKTLSLDARLAELELSERANPASHIDVSAVMLRIRGDLHGGQIDILDDTTTREIGVAAGYGAGKTLAACAKAFQLATLNPGCVGCVLEPTGPMLRDIWIRKFDAFLEQYEIPHTFRSSPLPEHILHLPDGDTSVIARSFENFKRIVGPDWAWAIADESDTVQEKIAAKAYDKILGRIRVGRVNQILSLSTPEGYSWHYKTFGTTEAAADPKKRLIRMRTQDNPHLPLDYIDNLRTRYTDAMLKAYMDGIYVNLTTGQVYDRFQRDHHVRPLEGGIGEGETLILGVDFNVGNMSGVLAVMRPYGIHVFAEVMKGKDTEDLALQVANRFKGHPIRAYPDASGASAKTNSSLSDLGVLKNHGFQIDAPRANPAVDDRVKVVQALLMNAKGETRLWIDPSCTTVIDSLERQPYDENGAPCKKSGYDHANDALGYPLHRIYAAALGFGPGGPMRTTTVHYGRGLEAPAPLSPEEKPERRRVVDGFR